MSGPAPARPFRGQNPHPGAGSGREKDFGPGSDAGLAPTRAFGPRPPRPAVEPTRRPPRRSPVRPRVLAAVVVGAVLAAGAVGVVGAGTRRSPQGPPTAERAQAGRRAADVPQARPAAPVVEYEGRRYRLGRPGDVVVQGDWDCDGTPTPALYRPSTGDAFVFRAWAGAGRPVRAEAAGRHPRDGVASVLAADAPGRCDVLKIERAD